MTSLRLPTWKTLAVRLPLSCLSRWISTTARHASPMMRLFPETLCRSSSPCGTFRAGIRPARAASSPSLLPTPSRSISHRELRLRSPVLDISERDFSSGLTCVAVSRVTSLQGLMFDVPFALDQIQVKNDVTGALRAADYKRRVDAGEVLVPGQMLA
ncbi:hypothetical protein B0T24DRAFT_372391 [Lasiosphaeria ovina]|uniref:Uncharacterized protein n=1 Tax=Lasiosphaeria ovina TaxID=92902 RepID=A0AAE0N168_9PEZI|nr:hypothetical protein B0T24DRAFT_372391 [Lasiosphaeria ovina]